MTKPFCLTAPCTIRAAQAAAGGAAAVPGTIDMLAYTGGLLEIEGWDYPLVCAVAGIRPAAELIPARIGHGQDETDVLGQIAVAIDPAAQTVRAAGTVTNYESPQARNVIAMARRDHQFQASIGGLPRRFDFIQRGQTAAETTRLVPTPETAIPAQAESGRMNPAGAGWKTASGPLSTSSQRPIMFLMFGQTNVFSRRIRGFGRSARPSLAHPRRRRVPSPSSALADTAGVAAGANGRGPAGLGGHPGADPEPVLETGKSVRFKGSTGADAKTARQTPAEDPDWANRPRESAAETGRKTAAADHPARDDQVPK